MEVRRITADGSELIQVPSDDGAPTVAERTVVEPAESPYSDVWANGETVVRTDGFCDGYATTALATIRKGVIAIGRVGGVGQTERDVLPVHGDTEITQFQHETGMGLWITRWIVEIFDGELAIDTGEDGTAVTIRLQPTGR